MKHGVAFEEARTVFHDPFALIFDDPAHSSWEQREILVGRSVHDRLLLVSFVEREGFIRIISARRVTWRERVDYEEGTQD
ncbi:MAG: BrnT family toxin [Planctomycetes bacterium]|nr:BrnT family toxin [Planctomycetota bacterium]